MYHPTVERKLYLKQCVEEIVSLVNLTKGKTLILFTAKSDMVIIYEELIKRNLSWKILIQQEGSSQDSVITEFKEDINFILLGTGAYWEGISIEEKP